MTSSQDVPVPGARAAWMVVREDALARFREAPRLFSGVMTSAVEEPGPLRLADVDRMMADWRRLGAAMRRSSVTVVVVLGHEGEPVTTRHPTDGTFLECSFAQAVEIHRTVPLKLQEIVAWDRAHYRVHMAQFDGPVLALRAPPYGPRP